MKVGFFGWLFFKKAPVVDPKSFGTGSAKEVAVPVGHPIGVRDRFGPVLFVV
jgi:hypothetical protein